MSPQNSQQAAFTGHMPRDIYSLGAKAPPKRKSFVGPVHGRRRHRPLYVILNKQSDSLKFLKLKIYQVVGTGESPAFVVDEGLLMLF